MALPTGNIDATDPATILSFDGSGFDATRVLSPTVVWDGSRYVMLYAGLPFGNNMQIGLGTSVDGTTWTPHSSDPVISNAASQPWGSFREIPVSAVYENGTYKLWFYGDNSNLSSDPGFGSGFGLATSTDAVNWTWDPGNPIRWELNAPQGNGFNLTEVLRLGGQYHAYFTDQDPAGDVLKHAVSADGITFSGDAQLTLPAGYQLRAATTATDGSTEYVLAVLESGGVQHYGTSLDGVNFTIQGSTDLPSTFGTGEVLVKDGQATFFGTVGVGNVNWPFGNAVIQSATGSLGLPIELEDVNQNLFLAAAELSNAAYQDIAKQGLTQPGWHTVISNMIGPGGISGDPDQDWTYFNGVFLGDAELSTGSAAIDQSAHLYEARLNGTPTLALAFAGTDDGLPELLEQGLVGWSGLLETYNEFLDQVIAYANDRGFEQFLLTGHSLGGALAQKFFLEKLAGTELADNSVIVTFGSPGSDNPRPSAGIPAVNVVHDDDLVPIQPFGERYGRDLAVERPEGSVPLLIEHASTLYLETAQRLAAASPELDLGGATFADLVRVAQRYTVSLAPEGTGGSAFPTGGLFPLRPDIVLGGVGSDVLHGESSPLVERNADLIWGGQGDDTVYAGGGNDTAFGGDGRDTLNGDRTGPLAVDGPTGGRDTLYGGAENDTLNGGGGNDTLVPGSGDDTVSGGFGIDTAIFGSIFADFIFERVGFLLREWLVTDTQLGNGDEGQDRLATVEFFRFDDGTFNTRTAVFTQDSPIVSSALSGDNDFVV